MALLASLVLLLLLWVACPARSFEFLNEAVHFASTAEYDYIVVGGGTAGCPLAATLSENFKVLLLERGGSPYGNPAVMRQEGFSLNLLADDGFSAAQTFYSTDGVRNARARVLGGGSCINAGFYSRADPDFIDELKFDKCLVNACYEWVEGVVASLPQLGPFQRAFRAALLQVGISPDNGATYEHLLGTKTGGSIIDKTGTRRPAANLLSKANPQNIKVVLHATVQRILFVEGSKRAYGVEYTDSLGVTHRALLSSNHASEVILSAGALGSSQLLMLSGIGPRDHLQQKGIPLLLDAPRVGKQMADNPCMWTLSSSPSWVETSLVQVAGVTPGSYIEAASGGGFITAMVQKSAKPLSRGELYLKTTEAGENPIVSFNYFAVPQDLQVCVEGGNLVEEILLSDAFKPFRLDHHLLVSGGTIKSPHRRNPSFAASVNSSIANHCRKNVGTIYHYHGGCLVGEVVDPDYRVLGVTGVRVVDGCTFKNSPGTNPQATVMMLGRYLGLKITQERTGIPTKCT